MDNSEMYRVFWPDGDLFTDANDESEFTRSDARVKAQAIGGSIERIEG
jgi:hypothetical protein